MALIPKKSSRSSQGQWHRRIHRGDGGSGPPLIFGLVGQGGFHVGLRRWQKPHSFVQKCATIHLHQCQISKIFRGRTPGPRIPGQGPPGKWWRRWKRGVTGKMQGKAEWEAMDGGQLLGYWNAPKRRSVSSLPITIAVCFTRYQCGCGGYALPMSPGKCAKTKL